MLDMNVIGIAVVPHLVSHTQTSILAGMRYPNDDRVPTSCAVAATHLGMLLLSTIAAAASVSSWFNSACAGVAIEHDLPLEPCLSSITDDWRSFTAGMAQDYRFPRQITSQRRSFANVLE